MKLITSPHKLSRAIRLLVAAPVFFGSATAVAAVPIVNLIEQTRTLRPEDPLRQYALQKNSKLIAHGVVSDAITAQTGSSVSLYNSEISPQSGGTALTLSESHGSVLRSTLSSATGVGIIMYLRSTLEVRNSTISGGLHGMNLAGASSARVVHSDLNGGTGAGLQLRGGSAYVIGGTISGSSSGVHMQSSNPDNTLVLDGVAVSATAGPAVYINKIQNFQGANHLTIANGTTLTSSTGVLIEVDDIAATVVVDNSDLVGDVDVSDTGTLDLTLQNGAKLTGRLINVQKLALNSGGQWNLIEDSEVGALSMSGGVVKFGETGQFMRLTADSLSGSGTFMMEADFSQGQTDFLEIIGQASGNHQLQVSASGADPLNGGNLHMVSIGSGDATFGLTGGRADIGTWSYQLIQNGNDWFLVQTRETSPSTNSVLALFNAAPTVLLGELSTLRSRMGELRQDTNQAGGWIRAYGNKYNVADSAGFGYKQVQQGLSLGADGILPVGDGQWLAGVMGGYSTSDLDLSRGTSGEVDSFYIGGYTTWLDPASGYYFDGVLKFNRLQNSSDVLMSDGARAKGEYNNHALSASAEMGRHIKLEDGWFAEPFTQVTAAVISGDTYSLDNGMRADGDTTYSLLGKAGSTLGRNLELAGGQVLQPYVKAALAHEFASNSQVKVNDHRFDNDLSGSRIELGAGVSMSAGERTRLHLDLDYAKGERIEQPWGVNLGVRYLW